MIFTSLEKKILEKVGVKKLFYKVQSRELKQMVVVVSFQVRQLPGETWNNFCLILGKSKCLKQIKSG